ncbi:MAG: carbohydrate-binding domain-containing protein [Bacteroidaceae bacterium]|nr:carbohydrate-binding domain-containing protein [Bacteroidaceae bacterium]
MKKHIYIMALLATTGLQAQVLNINNSDGTFLPVETTDTKEITFNETQKTVTLTLDGGLQHIFHTGKVESISPKTDKKNQLTYDFNPEITFDENDKNEFNEVIETIPDVETTENDYGDFVEKFAVGTIVNIVFSENDVTVSGNIPYTKHGAHLTINSESGKVGYFVSGKSSNGSLKIYSLKKFQLMLSGVDLTNPAGPAINIQTGKTIYLTIDENTTNHLCDGATYNAPDVADEDQKGTLFSEGQLVFDGAGTLNITSLGGHGVCSDDYIRIRSGNINIIQAAKDGFHTNDKFIIGRTKTASPTITVNATNDGIDCGKGDVIIDAGKLEITTGGEAIKVSNEDADPLVTASATINGGYIKFTTTGDKSSGIKTEGAYKQTGGIIHGIVKGNGSKLVNCDNNITFTNGKLIGFAEGTILNDTTSTGGIKCEGEFSIQKGTIAIECNGKGAKGINCNKATIKGGDITVISMGEDYIGISETRKSKAIDTGNITITNGNCQFKAYDSAVSATKVSIYKGTLHAISENDTAIDAEIAQSGGWIMTKDNQ